MSTGNRGGRPRKPTALHVLNGNPSKIPNLDERFASEPQPDVCSPESVPSPPDYFPKEARKCWDINARMLSRMKLLTEADLMALEVYCMNYFCFQSVAKKVKGRKGIIHKPHEGTNPNTTYEEETRAAQAMRAFSKELLNWSREFGMTPAARGRMVLPEEKEAEDEMEQLLTGRK